MFSEQETESTVSRRWARVGTAAAVLFAEWFFIGTYFGRGCGLGGALTAITLWSIVAFPLIFGLPVVAFIVSEKLRLSETYWSLIASLPLATTVIALFLHRPPSGVCSF